MIPCAICGKPTTVPKYNLTHAQRAKRRCKACLTDLARQNGRRTTAHYSIEPTIEAMQVILGSALGDGGFERNSTQGEYLLSIKHCLAQHDYLRWKAKLLGPLARKPTPTEHTKLRVRSRTHPCFTQTRTRVRSTDESIFRGFVADMDLLAWTIFYLDDGNLTPEHTRPNGYTDKTTVRIACPMLTPNQRQWVRDGLELRFDTETTECTWTNPRDRAAPYHGIRLYGTSALRFLRATAPIIPSESGMLYKVAEPALTIPA